jgi:hypothetical protein
MKRQAEGNEDRPEHTSGLDKELGKSHGKGDEPPKEPPCDCQQQERPFIVSNQSSVHGTYPSDRLLYGSVPKHKAALLLDAESGSWYNLGEPGLPGRCRKGGYEGPAAHHAVGPFYFASALAVLRAMGIISRVGRERKEYGVMVIAL